MYINVSLYHSQQSAEVPNGTPSQNTPNCPKLQGLVVRQATVAWDHSLTVGPFVPAASISWSDPPRIFKWPLQLLLLFLCDLIFRITRIMGVVPEHSSLDHGAWAGGGLDPRQSYEEVATALGLASPVVLMNQSHHLCDICDGTKGGCAW